MKILIAGATGLTGQRLVPQLMEAGHQPVALVRESSDLSVLPDACETVTADLTDLPENVCEGFDAVVFVAGSGGDTSAEMTEKVDRDGAQALVDRAKAAKVKRFVMLSARGVEDPDPDAALHHYLVAKKAADDYLIASGVSYSIVRPGSLTREDGQRNVRLGDDATGDGTTARGDLAAVIVRALDEPGLADRAYRMESVNS